MPKSTVLLPAKALQPARPQFSVAGSPPTDTSTRALAPSLSGQQLTAFVRQLALDPRSWSELVEHRRDRWWTRLIGTQSLDVWLITWPLDVATELHDHGDSWAAFTVVEGELVEHTAFPGGRRLSSRRWRPGSVGVVPPGDIHDVFNSDSRPAASIHAYSPPLQSMTYYAQSGGVLRPTRTTTPESTNGWAP
ncbi:MAG: cysteine dioxygenase [Actinobacteria bacterium]|nr:MAG: cysteine dioxygenase [Actinomycetota bacterium]